MVMTVEWYDAQYTSASVLKHTTEVVQDDEEMVVTGEAAVILSGDSAAVVEGDVATLLNRFRFVVSELEQLQVSDRSMHLEQNLGEVLHNLSQIHARNVLDRLLRGVSPAAIENMTQAEIIASFVLNDHDSDVLDTPVKIMARVAELAGSIVCSVGACVRPTVSPTASALATLIIAEAMEDPDFGREI